METTIVKQVRLPPKKEIKNDLIDLQDALLEVRDILKFFDRALDSLVENDEGGAGAHLVLRNGVERLTDFIFDLERIDDLITKHMKGSYDE